MDRLTFEPAHLFMGCFHTFCPLSLLFPPLSLLFPLPSHLLPAGPSFLPSLSFFFLKPLIIPLFLPHRFPPSSLFLILPVFPPPAALSSSPQSILLPSVSPFRSSSPPILSAHPLRLSFPRWPFSLFSSFSLPPLPARFLLSSQLFPHLRSPSSFPPSLLSAHPLPADRLLASYLSFHPLVCHSERSEGIPPLKCSRRSKCWTFRLKNAPSGTPPV